MNWDQIVAQVRPHVVRIDTPSVFGTGFLCLSNTDRSLVGIATARHVVAHADKWLAPIRISSEGNKTANLCLATERSIWIDPNTDCAVIIASPSAFGLEASLSSLQNLPPLFPCSSTLPIGSSVGWLGYPSIADTMCFFRGVISAVELSPIRTYLIDGVAINGVSGGPVFYCDPDANNISIVGVISAYRPNRLYDESLPGLSIAQDVSHLHNAVLQIKTIDDAERIKHELQLVFSDAYEKTFGEMSRLLKQAQPALLHAMRHWRTNGCNRGGYARLIRDVLQSRFFTHH